MNDSGTRQLSFRANEPITMTIDGSTQITYVGDLEIVLDETNEFGQANYFFQVTSDAESAETYVKDFFGITDVSFGERLITPDNVSFEAVEFRQQGAVN